MKRVSALLLTLLLLGTLALPALAAESGVVYSGHSIFGFGPGSEFTDTDLFDGFKDVMPGDVLTETITVKNTAKCCDFIKIYIRAEVHDEKDNPLSPNVEKTGETVATMKDFLSQLTLKVWNGKKLIFEGSPDQAAGLKSNVLLGQFRRNKGTTLTAELSVPAELGNEYAHRTGEVDWVFQIEEYDDKDPENPKTGDESHIFLYLTIMAVSLLLLAALLILAKKKKTK